jgi:hypothetical protein
MSAGHSRLAASLIQILDVAIATATMDSAIGKPTGIRTPLPNLDSLQLTATSLSGEV